MAYSRIQGIKAGGGGTTNPLIGTLANPVGVGHAVFVGATCTTPTKFTVTCTDDKGNTYNQGVLLFTGDRGPPDDYEAVAFYSLNIQNAPRTITLTWSGTPTAISEMVVEEMAGLSPSSTFDGGIGLDNPTGYPTTPNGVTTSGATITLGLCTGPFVTTQNGDLIWSQVSLPGTGTLTAGTVPVTYQIGQSTPDDTFTEWGTYGAASSNTVVTWTTTTTQETMLVAMAFSPTGSTQAASVPFGIIGLGSSEW